MADAPDLGSGVPDVQVQVLLPVLFTRVSEVFITSEILIFLSFFLYERIPQCRLTRI